MNSFQRMIAIPQEEYLALSSMQNVNEPLAQHFYDLESRYRSEEKLQDPYRRMMLQGNTLDQMKQVKEQLRNSLAIATPKPYQSRANALFQTVENILKFNDKGEIYSEDGTLVSGSRVEDLIQHAVRDRRRNLMPTGWSDFLTILRKHNVPKSILNRDTLDELEGKATPIPTMKMTTARKSRLPLPTNSKFPINLGPGYEFKQRKQSKSQKRGRRSQPPRRVKPTVQDFDFVRKYNG